MRAMSDNSIVAKASGVETTRVNRWTWMIAGILITVAGTLYAIQVQLRPALSGNFSGAVQSLRCVNFSAFHHRYDIT